MYGENSLLGAGSWFGFISEDLLQQISKTRKVDFQSTESSYCVRQRMDYVWIIAVNIQL